MTAVPHGLTLAQTSAMTRRITFLSLAVAVTLSLLKLWAYLASGSVTMLASLADSGLDFLAAATTFFAVRQAVAPPDSQHRFGHGKVEAFAALVQAGLVFASAALIGREAIGRILHPAPILHEDWDLLVMCASVALTSGLILAQTRVLRRAASVAVSGDRIHYVADLASNILAFAGIGLNAVIGGVLPDAIGGLLVAGVLVWGAIGVFRASSTELMDQELPAESRTRIAELMMQDARIRDVHQLRTRASGPYIHVQMHADLDPSLSLVEAHEAVVAAEQRVLTDFPTADIIIHQDPRGVAQPHGGAFGEHEETADDELHESLHRQANG